MLQKLKRKFFIATVIALTVVIGMIVGAINILNYQSVISDADIITDLIMENSGRFPSKPGNVDPDLDVELTPESPYESRYFSVSYRNGRLKSVDTSSIAAITDNDAISMVRSILSHNRERGFKDNYRYLVVNDGTNVSIICLDCTKSLDHASNFLLSSITISLLGILLVSAILWVISEKIVRPVTETYEKQRRFITDAGHDIKTPLTIIDADAELLEMEVGKSEWLTDIKKQIERLTTLTGELIYLSRMEERESIAHSDFPISDIAEETIISFNALAKTKNIVIVKSISPAVYYHGDEEAIKKLLTLLLDNAIKYSPEDNAVKADLKKHGRNIIIKVSNMAPDLSDKDLDNIFDRFYRSDKSRSTSGGFGIGLSVAEAIVSVHKGKISAHKQGNQVTIEVVL